MRKHVVLLTAAVGLALVGAQLAAVVDEIKAQDREFWRLDFRHTGLHYVHVGGELVAYMPYQVVNNTGADREFAPLFEVTTDTKQLTYALPNPVAAEAIRRKHREKLLDLGEITGTIKQGETKVGVAIFRKLDPEADTVKVDITGITDAYRYQDEEARTGFQRRVYHIEWYRPGDAMDRDEDPVETKHDGYIWRSIDVGAVQPEG
jgi:hypothetical protein